MEKVEDYTNNVGYSERTNVPIEPKLSTQWFLRMKHFADLALSPVMNDEIEFYPKKYKNTYRHWLENIKDWCISRQLWWGHRIPAYYFKDLTGKTQIVVAQNQEEALDTAKKINKFISIEDLQQESDCLDTWFSSWLWPISLFNGINNPNNEEINYYYPTSDLVTGPDIIFFWVARMIMAGYEYRGTFPFKHVYFTGIVRDKLGRKMSKSLGNSPDPLDLIDRYGADGVRMGMMLSAPAGNDILFDESLCEQGRNFNNKIWNAFRLVKGWKIDAIKQPEINKIAIQWFEAKLKIVYKEVEAQFASYRISEALMTVYKLFWDEFSSWYLEMIKPNYGEPIDETTYTATLKIFDTLLKLLHPFMPFITEELWQHLVDRKQGESIMVEQLKIKNPTLKEKEIVDEIENVKQVVSGIRTIRNQRNIPIKTRLSLDVIGDDKLKNYQAIIVKMGNVDKVKSVGTKEDNSSTFMVGTLEYAVPLGSLIDIESEIKRLNKELSHLEGFLKGVKAKLSNEKFVAHAPEAVVIRERKKQSDAEEKITLIKTSIENLRRN